MGPVSEYVIDPFSHRWESDFRIVVDKLLLEYGLKRIHISVHIPDQLSEIVATPNQKGDPLLKSFSRVIYILSPVYESRLPRTIRTLDRIHTLFPENLRNSLRESLLRQIPKDILLGNHLSTIVALR